MKKIWLIVLVLVSVQAFSALRAQDSDVQERIRKMEEQIAAQQAALEELKARVNVSSDEEKKMMQEVAKKEVSSEFKKTNLTGFKFGGDVRARYEGTCFDDDKTPTRNRFRYRLRFNAQKSVGSGVMGYFQLASGSTKLAAGADLGGEGTSTNQTFGDSFDRKGVWIDQAYLTWTPDIPGHFFTLGAGKFKNIFVMTPGLPLLWDTDLNPEGFFQQIQPTFGNIKPFINLGQTIVKENGHDADAYMFAWQGGMTGKIEKVALTGAVSYYHYVRYATNYKYTNGNTVVKVGNKDTLGAGEFNLLGFVGKVSAPLMAGIPVEGAFEYNKNRGNRLHTGVDADQDTAWNVGVMLGKNKSAHDWSFYYTYRHIEANALVGAFCDSDFGFTNRKGHVIFAKYNLFDNLALGANYFNTKPVTGTAAGFSRFMIDLEFKF